MKYWRWMILWVLVGVILSACSQPGAQGTTPTVPPVLASPSPIVPTPQPTPTPEPPRVFLFAPTGTNAQLTQQTQTLLEELGKPSALRLETRSELKPGDLNASVKVVVLLSQPQNLSELSSAAPQTQFVVFTTSDLKAAGNISVIRQAADQQAFAAGFLATTLSKDWRSSALLPAEPALLKVAFANGGHYFCGTCAPGWPLRQTYPAVTTLPANSDGGAWKAAADDLIQNKKVEVLYLAPETLKPELVNYLSNKKLLLLGSQTPPEELKSLWVATFGLDPLPALRQIWPAVSTGKGGQQASALPTLSEINREKLGQGHEDYVKAILKDLSTGLIGPLDIP